LPNANCQLVVEKSAIGNRQSIVQPANKHRFASFHEYSIPRERMVARLRDHYGIRDPRVLEAMRSVPRHLFVPEALQSRAYGDHALPISANQTISQPFIVARMTELLELDENSRVLEIGAGSGYQTAVLSRIAAQVYSIERIADLAREAQARIRQLEIYNATVKCLTAPWVGLQTRLTMESS
jgi:Protein-L-isoaspartate carboxylmethyltransferase